MNLVNLDRLIVALEKADPEQIDMETYWSVCELTESEISELPHTNGSPPCGTSACIAGWATFLVAADPKEEIIYHKDKIDFKVTARRFLGLTPLQAEGLFFDCPPWANHKEEILATLRRVRAAGKVTLDLLYRPDMPHPKAAEYAAEYEDELIAPL